MIEAGSMYLRFDGAYQHASFEGLSGYRANLSHDRREARTSIEASVALRLGAGAHRSGHGP